MKSPIIKLLVLLLVLKANALSAQKLTDTIPLPKTVISGQLPSGLQYFVHPNTNPSKKIELRLIVGVGSIVEKPGQRGMAHLLEHMAFNGSKNFPGDSITQSLRSLGIKYGYDLNAYTGYDKTVYILPIPSDKPENIDLGLQILHEWTNNLSLLPEEIKAEKKVVYQEIKDFVQYDDFAEFKLTGSEYFKKTAIGTEEQVKAISYKGLKEFYDTWYRPDMITIVAVGDMDAHEMEEKIRKQFSGFTARGKSQEREKYSLPTHGDIEYKQVIDSSIYDDRIELLFPAQDQNIQTYSDLRKKLVQKLFTRILDQRLDRDSLVNCDYSNLWYLSSNAHVVFDFNGSKGKNLLEDIRKTAAHLNNIRQHGIIKEELEQIKSEYLDGIKDQDDSYNSAFWADSYIDRAIVGDYHVSNRLKKEFYQQYIAEISSEEIQHEADMFFDQSRKMLICVRNRSGNKKYDRKDVLKAWKKGLKEKGSAYAYTPKEKKEEELKKYHSIEIGKLAKAKIVKERYYEDLGVTELYLNNGLRVALRPTQSNEKEITVSFLGRGGLSVLPDSLYHRYESTAAYVDMGGAGQYSYEQLGDIMYDLDISISTLIADYYQSLYGSAPTGDIENLLKLFYLKIKSPGRNYKEYKEVVEAEAEDFGTPNPMLERLNKTAGRIQQRKIAEYCGRIPANVREFKSAEELKAVRLDSLTDFYSQLFGKMKGSTMLITGKFNVDSVKHLAAKYMGALPANLQNNKARFMGKAFPEGIHRDTIVDSTSERAQMCYLIHGEHKHSLRERFVFFIMRDLIQGRLLKKLREEMGMIYSPFVRVNYTSYPREMYAFQIEYSCDAEKADLLESVLFEELEQLAKTPVSQSEINKISQSFLVTKRNVLTPDNYSGWRKKLQEVYLEENDLDDYEIYKNCLRTVTPKDIQQAFKRYINNDRFTVISISK